MSSPSADVAPTGSASFNFSRSTWESQHMQLHSGMPPTLEGMAAAAAARVASEHTGACECRGAAPTQSGLATDRPAAAQTFHRVKIEECPQKEAARRSRASRPIPRTGTGWETPCPD